jgi:hypothetical protein
MSNTRDVTRLTLKGHPWDAHKVVGGSSRDRQFGLLAYDPDPEMRDEASSVAEGLRLAELMSALSLATDLGGPPGEFVSRVMPRVGAGQRPVRRVRLVAGMMR